MNIDFIPSAKSSASKSALSGSADNGSKTESMDDSGDGFFSKLAALFKGEAETETKGAKVEGKGSSSTENLDDVESDVKSEKVAAVASEVDGDMVDELLADDEEGKVSSANVDASGAKAGGKNADKLDTEEVEPKAVAAGIASGASSSELTSQRVMGDGDEILSKLKQANQVLSKANQDATQVSDGDMMSSEDGKSLPSSEVLSSQGNVAKQKADGVDSELAASTASIGLMSSSDSPMVNNLDEAQLPTQEKNVATQLGQVADDGVSEADAMLMAAAVKQALPQQVAMSGAPQDSQDQSEVVINPEQLKALLADPEFQQKTSGLSESEKVALAQALLSEPTDVELSAEVHPNAQEQDEGDDGLAPLSPLASAAAGATVSSPSVQGSTGSTLSSAPSSIDNAAGTPAKLGMESKALGVELTESDTDSVAAKGALEGEGAKAVSERSARPLSAQALSMLSAQQMAERATQSSASASPATSASNSESVASSAASAAALASAGSALLSGNLDKSKASWSAAHLEAAGIAARETEKAHEAKEGSFAQHLSAFGAGSTQSSSLQLKPEMAQAQPPVMVTKDVAADQLSERVQMMLSKNLKNIDIRLDPPELGRMHIRMNMNGDAATVHFTVANQQVRDALEGSMPRLREMLSQQGVQLGETAVQHQGANQQQGYASGGRAQSQSGTNFSGDGRLGDDNFDSDVKLDLNVATKRDGISYYA